MKKNTIIVLLAAAIIVAGIFTAGCTQDASSGSTSAGNSQHYSTSGGDNRTSAAADGSWNSGSNGNRQFSGQSYLTNETLLAAAAGKLGVSEQDIKNALDSTKNATSGRPDLSAAAQKIGVTPQQLTDALGIRTGGRIRSGGYNANQTPGQ
ncbi:hypothetical protein [uncultured Methanoregula sp.]|uniref:hypothetical protein n=1 Tax=uncultured Methanoregula sp. TaxID=1005933 RepID=UPI002AAB121A|nr:hypothetical protein [uncultured Methanoregula sp.]